MSDKNFPAYPVLKDNFYEPDMTMRDWFAGQALQGMLASSPLCDRTKANKNKWAVAAYEFATAMLTAREALEKKLKGE